MRLIDAEALKKHKVYSEERHEYVVPVYNIDNAPTVEQTIITEFKGCDNCELERPQGEWIVGSEYNCFSHIEKTYTCPFCNHKFYTKYPFCTCGADMRKGGNR